jgi:hypothetical protein
MYRILMGISILATVLMAGAAVSGLVMSPMNARRAELAENLAEASVVTLDIPETPVPDYEAMVSGINERPALWQPLVEKPAPPPPPPPPPPDWNAILQGVEVTRQKIGSGADLKVRIITSPQSRGDWMQVGGRINDAVIKEITETHVVFSVMKDGKEWTHRLARP